MWVRLVKGAYWDYETVHAQSQGWPIPVYQQKWETDANYERQTRFLLRNWDMLAPGPRQPQLAIAGPCHGRGLALGRAADRL